MVVESDDALRDRIVAVLSDAGYDVSTDYREGMKAILAFNPDAPASTRWLRKAHAIRFSIFTGSSRT